MNYTRYRIDQPASISVRNHCDLRRFWQYHLLGIWSGIVGPITVEKPLTASQRQRLPKDLREHVMEASDGR